MSLLKKLQLNKDTRMVIWKLDESVKELQKKLPEKRIPHIKNEKRKKEYLATRIALKELTDSHLYYDHFGAPKIRRNKHISISHSQCFICIAISKTPIGIDIEKVSAKTLKLSKKFISKGKHIEITKNKATLIWSAKECIFKLQKRKSIDFKNDIIIEPFLIKEKGILKAYFMSENYKLNYEKLYNHYLVYVCN